MNTAATLSNDADFVRVKVIRSHIGVSRFFAETSSVEESEPAGWVKVPASIPSPFASGDVKPVYRWRDAYVLCVETRHKVYEVFSVSPRLVYASEDLARGPVSVAPNSPIARYYRGFEQQIADRPSRDARLDLLIETAIDELVGRGIGNAQDKLVARYLVKARNVLATVRAK